MKLSTRARYALRLMIDLADQGAQAPVVLRDVAERQRISRRYLEQLATGLRNANLIATAPGKNGGYSLQRAPEQICVGEIIDATIGPVDLIRCVGSPALCTRSEVCPSRRMWSQVKARIDEVLRSMTLADLREGALSPELEPSARPSPCSSE